MDLPPIGFFVEVGAAGIVSGLVLFATWRWRRHGWPSAVAVGAGFAATFYVALIRGNEDWTFAWRPTDVTRFALQFALGGALLGSALSWRRTPALVRWIAPLGAAASIVWLLLGRWSPNRWPDAGERTVWLTGIAVLHFAAWKSFDVAAGRVRGWRAPLFLMLTAGAVGHAVGMWGNSGLLGQFAGALAAALAPCVLFGLILSNERYGAGVSAVAFVLLGHVLICSVYFGDLAPWSAVLFALAPSALLMSRPRWAKGVLLGLALATAMFLAWHAARPDPADSEPDPYEQYR